MQHKGWNAVLFGPDSGEIAEFSANQALWRVHIPEKSSKIPCLRKSAEPRFRRCFVVSGDCH
jgi:hypothetical protein